MGIIKWYKRDPTAALKGMMELTLEERGAYNTVLDLIYSHDGAVKDDAAFIAPWLNVDQRVWKRLRTKLLSVGKLYVYGGSLRNERADHEVYAAQHRVVSAMEAANKRWSTFNDIKKLRHAAAMLPTSTKKEILSAKIVPIPDNRDRKPKEN